MTAHIQVLAIVPAAGYATRLQPLNCSKELIPVGRMPIIDHLIGRMQRVAADEDIVVVTRPDKTDVIAHVEARGHEVALGEPANVSESLLLGLQTLAGRPAKAATRVVIAGFPDTLFEPDDAFARLIAALTSSGADVVLGLFESPEPARGDVVELDDDGWVTSVVPKPQDPATNLVWGLFAATPAALAGLAGYSEPGAYFSDLAQGRRVRGVRLGADYVDIGIPDALARYAPEVFGERDAQLRAHEEA